MPLAPVIFGVLLALATFVFGHLCTVYFGRGLKQFVDSLKTPPPVVEQVRKDIDGPLGQEVVEEKRNSKRWEFEDEAYHDEEIAHFGLSDADVEAYDVSYAEISAELNLEDVEIHLPAPGDEANEEVEHVDLDGTMIVIRRSRETSPTRGPVEAAAAAAAVAAAKAAAGECKMKFALLITAFLVLSATAESPSRFLEQTDESLFAPPSNEPGQNQWLKVLTNPKFEGYSVRIKKPRGCDKVVQVSNLDFRAYSGYLDTDNNDHFFFWFFESRFDPESDPLILWMNGGPGCSSLTGLWMELGIESSKLSTSFVQFSPCLVNEHGNATKRNNYSWNAFANVLFLDQPVNVGYSYGESKVASTAAAAKHVYVFLQLFFGEFLRYSELPFHIAGESYGFLPLINTLCTLLKLKSAGHYVPALAAEVIKNNAVASENDFMYINFESILLGNGWVDALVQFEKYADFSCNNAYKTIYSEEECREIRDAYPRCAQLINVCYKYPSSLFCVPARVYCQKYVAGPFEKTGLNPYDIRLTCEPNTTLCYPALKAVEKWANLPEVRTEIGVDDEAGNMLDHAKFFPGILEAGIRVLIYAGKSYIEIIFFLIPAPKFTVSAISHIVLPSQATWIGFAT
ncbi:hypothetical protein BC936DRAFT_138297, partial [Jimgerdemannia flammicorona]